MVRSDRSSRQKVDDGLETFIIVHDQRLLLEVEQQGRFASLYPCRYLFVGPGPTDLIAHRDDVVVARQLSDNIEEHPQLLSYTAWYAVARNRLARASYVALLEYDVSVSVDFKRATIQALSDSHAIVGYEPERLTNPHFLHNSNWLAESLSATYGLDVAELVRKHLAGGGTDRWTASTNHAMRVDDLRDFVDWFTPLACSFWHDLAASAVHERSIWVFCRLNGVEDKYVSGVLRHDQAESHGRSVSYAEVASRADASEPLLMPSDTHSRLQALDQALAAEAERASRLEMDLGTERGNTQRLEVALAEEEIRVRQRIARTECAEAARDALLRSRSWRITEPARALGRALRRARTSRGRG